MKRRRYLTALLVGASLAGGVPAQPQTPVIGQQQQRIRREGPPPQEREVDRVIVTTGPEGEMPFHFETVTSGAGPAFGFSFVSSEMSFSGKLVKGAPFSAEAVTETVQTLSDGNRINRKSSSMLYRDTEGRTRRDQSLNAIGPWATADEPTQSVFIDDPVSGTHFILDPRTRTARQSRFFFRTSVAPDGGGNAFEFHVATPPAPGEPAAAKTIQAGNLGPRSVLKRVPPEYPSIAKAAGAQGTVEVEVVINERGEVESARATKGHPLLQQSAVDAARQWQFNPTLLSGKPVKVTGRVSFNFVLPLKEEGDVMMKSPAPPGSPEFIAAAPLGHGPRRISLPEVKESLGKQSVEGVEAEGTRTTVTIAAGSIGNDRPIQIVSERWYSPELQLVVMSRHADPRFGETTYRLTNINRGEPARTLFEVPADYTLKEERAPFGGQRRMMRSKQQQ